MITQKTLIIGANSAIAQAIATEHSGLSNSEVILVSRGFSDNVLVTYQNLQNTRLISVEDYTVSSIELACIKIQADSTLPITNVFVCNGILHSETIQPEKRLEDFDAESFNQVMSANALTPMLWLQKLVPILTGKIRCNIIVFSARVGSISENKLGGWYSYRASKAALNMMLKTASVELARRAKNIKVIVFHPGTTDTELSKPFHKNVPKGKLFTCEFVAQQLLEVVKGQELDQTASFLDWKGETINW
ncbi:SDR family NAD(P)-dependent oxidoreductase [uncultured Psychrosphaera sp.]|uniref:SDR family NAD(P)-dependent oxidoreductase n=1 Tax=uncultured Psychrosphaera sp. TaxID=1403522 RepID=UPI0026092ECC|nr:SDR family NAD(P)-dependent oxidoreductase [uncultured Psychrosphaera sp.]